MTHCFPAGLSSVLYLVQALAAAVLLSCRGLAWSSEEIVLGEGVRLRAFAACDGGSLPAGSLMLRQDARRVSAELTAPQEGTYRFGLMVEAPRVSPLAPGLASYSAGSLLKPMTIRYPYDWTWRGKGHVLPQAPRLVMPGIEAGGTVCLVDTHELTSISLEAAGEVVRAMLWKHAIYNDGADAATPELRLAAGERSRLEVLLFSDLRSATRARSGTARRLQGRMMQIPFRGWTTAGLTPQQYERAAQRLQGVFDCIIVRETEIRDWLPPIFHRRGIRVLAYQYLGAWRRGSSQVTPEVERSWGLQGADGSLYTAPRSPNGNWLLCDLRRPAVRRRFVEEALAAVEAGFDGVFLDGYPFWPDAAGRCGGSVPGAAQSLASARWLLLVETREAIRAANPNACLGVLANDYYDSLGAADLVLKEGMYFTWDGFAEEFSRRGTRINCLRDADYEEREAPFVPTNLVYGAKGLSPLAVQSCFGFLRRPTGLTYCEPGDFFPRQLDLWLDALRAIATYDGPVIRRIEPPNRWIRFTGQWTLWCDAACTVEFSRPVRVAADGDPGPGAPVQILSMGPGTRYRVAAGG